MLYRKRRKNLADLSGPLKVPDRFSRMLIRLSEIRGKAECSEKLPDM